MPNGLKKHPDACKEYPSHGGTGIKGAAKKHEHGSVTCVAAFLGETNWNRTKVGVLLEIADCRSRHLPNLQRWRLLLPPLRRSCPSKNPNS